MRRITIKDVLVLTALAALVGVPITTVFADAQRETANRVKCARNLMQVGRALMLYANENRGKYPRTTRKENAPPVWGTPYEADKKATADQNCDPFTDGKKRPGANDVTSAIYLLIRTEDIVPDVFVCPSSRLKPWDFGGDGHSAQEFTNWNGNAGLAAHLSYSYQNPYPSNDAMSKGFKLDNTLAAEFAVLADLNPGGDAVTGVTINSPAEAIRTANSRNHNGDGQNVLYGDGHVEFQQTPFVGVNRDNIYTANGPEHDRTGAKPTIVASPADPDDSILLPTASDIGQKIEVLDAAEQAKLDAADAAVAPDVLKRAHGVWSRAFVDGQIIRIELSDNAIVATVGPVTANYKYTLDSGRDGGALITLTGHDMNPALAMLTIEDTGKLRIEVRDRNLAPLAGEWTKGELAATRPARPTSQPKW